MEYNVTAVSNKPAETLGFQGEGQLEISDDSLQITGRRQNHKLARLTQNGAMVCLAIFFLLLFFSAEMHELVGRSAVWLSTCCLVISVILLYLPVVGNKQTIVSAC